MNIKLRKFSWINKQFSFDGYSSENYNSIDNQDYQYCCISGVDYFNDFILTLKANIENRIYRGSIAMPVGEINKIQIREYEVNRILPYSFEFHIHSFLKINGVPNIYLFYPLQIKNVLGESNRVKILNEFFKYFCSIRNIQERETVFIIPIGVRGRMEMMGLSPTGHCVVYVKSGNTAPVQVDPRGSHGPQPFFNDTACVPFSACIALNMVEMQITHNRSLLRAPQFAHAAFKEIKCNKVFTDEAVNTFIENSKKAISNRCLFVKKSPKEDIDTPSIYTLSDKDIENFF